MGNYRKQTYSTTTFPHIVLSVVSTKMMCAYTYSNIAPTNTPRNLLVVGVQHFTLIHVGTQYQQQPQNTPYGCFHIIASYHNVNV